MQLVARHIFTPRSASVPLQALALCAGSFQDGLLGLQGPSSTRLLVLLWNYNLQKRVLVRPTSHQPRVGVEKPERNPRKALCQGAGPEVEKRKSDTEHEARQLPCGTWAQ